MRYDRLRSAAYGEGRYDTLLEIMTDWRMGASGDNPVEARAYIEEEITEYAAILSGD